MADLYQRHAAVIESAYPAIACNVAGYNLRGLVRDGRLHLHRLLCGAEGTLAVATRLRLRLAARPAADSLVVAYFDDIVQAARAVQYAMTLSPSGIEVMDKSLLQLAQDSDPSLRGSIPAGIDNVLLIEFDGASAEACAKPAETVCGSFALNRLGAAGAPGGIGARKSRFLGCAQSSRAHAVQAQGQAQDPGPGGGRRRAGGPIGALFRGDLCPF